MKRLQKRHGVGRTGNGVVPMHHFDTARQICHECRHRAKERLRRNDDARRARETSLCGREQAYAMTELDKSLHQRRDHALCPAISPHRQAMVGQQRDVQASDLRPPASLGRRAATRCR